MHTPEYVLINMLLPSVRMQLCFSLFIILWCVELDRVNLDVTNTVWPEPNPPLLQRIILRCDFAHHFPLVAGVFDPPRHLVGIGTVFRFVNDNLDRVSSLPVATKPRCIVPKPFVLPIC